MFKFWKKDKAAGNTEGNTEGEVIHEVKIEPTTEHVHDETCNHEHQTVTSEIVVEEPKEEKKAVPLGYREAKYLKKARYDKIAPKFNTAYVLKNIKTNQIAEIRAASSFHACNLIGWNKNKVVVVSESVIPEPKETVNDAVAHN